MSYRPCKYRNSQLGIFQCERHFYQHTSPEQYDELYHFCLKHIPDEFCPYLDFGFDMAQDPPRVYMNCTHTYYARPLRSIEDCESCPFPDKKGQSLG